MRLPFFCSVAAIFAKNQNQNQKKKKMSDEKIFNFIVTLTAVPPRYMNLAQVLGSLRGMTLAPREIWLNLPKRYVRFPECVDPAAELAKHLDLEAEGAHAVSPLRVFWLEEDQLALNKLLPTLARLKKGAAAGGEEQWVMVCDDDHTFPKTYVAELLAPVLQFYAGAPLRARLRLDAVGGRRMCWAGKGVPAISFSFDNRWVYPDLTPLKGNAAYVEGWQGYFLQPCFFDEAVFAIPFDWVGCVDDHWFSANMLRNGVELYWNFHTLREKPEHIEDPKALVPLCARPEKQSNTEQIIHWCQEHFHVWTACQL
jgi:hypothetical protein